MKNHPFLLQRLGSHTHLPPECVCGAKSLDAELLCVQILDLVGGESFGLGFFGIIRLCALGSAQRRQNKTWPTSSASTGSPEGAEYLTHHLHSPTLCQSPGGVSSKLA